MRNREGTEDSVDGRKKARSQMSNLIYLISMIIFVIVWMFLPRVGEHTLVFYCIRGIALFGLAVAWLWAWIIKIRDEDGGWVGKIAGCLFIGAITIGGIFLIRNAAADFGTEPVTLVLSDTDIAMEPSRRSISVTDELQGDYAGEPYEFRLHRGDLPESDRERIREEHPYVEVCYYPSSKAIVSFEILEGYVPEEQERAQNWLSTPIGYGTETSEEVAEETEKTVSYNGDVSYEEVDFATTGVTEVAVGDSWQKAFERLDELGYFADPSFSMNYYTEFTEAQELFGIEEGQYCIAMTNLEYRIVLIYNRETNAVERIISYRIVAE